MFSNITKKFGTKNVNIVILIVILSLLAYLRSGSESKITASGEISRPEYLEGEENICITADIEGVGKEDVYVSIGEKKLTTEECELLFNEFYVDLVETFLNGNEAFDTVNKDLSFPEMLAGYPFEIEWECRDNGIFDDSGRLISNLEGTTEITCLVSYEEWSTIVCFVIGYQPKETYSISEMKDDLCEEIKEIEENTREDDYIVLPNTVNGYGVTYFDKMSSRNPIILLIGFVASAATLYASKIDEEKERKKRQEKIQQEYAIVIQKIVMYLSSGMSLRNIWRRIYEDRGKKNPIYEEIFVMINELNTGISEEQAYMNFANRIGLAEITRMTSLLSQNLRKGSTKLSELLSEEAAKAFEDRKRRARIRGEEAGTKLLAPMVILMIIVLVIIMIPAFLSF